jgi:hypothetical protein
MTGRTTEEEEKGKKQRRSGVFSERHYIYYYCYEEAYGKFYCPEGSHAVPTRPSGN